MDVPSLGPLTGFFAGLAWKGFEVRVRACKLSGGGVWRTRVR